MGRRHLVVNHSWKTDSDWKVLELNRLGFVGIVTRKLQSFKASRGIYSLPDRDADRTHYEEAMRELEILRKAGASFAAVTLVNHNTIKLQTEATR